MISKSGRSDSLFQARSSERLLILKLSIEVDNLASNDVCGEFIDDALTRGHGTACAQLRVAGEPFHRVREGGCVVDGEQKSRLPMNNDLAAARHIACNHGAATSRRFHQRQGHSFAARWQHGTLFCEKAPATSEFHSGQELGLGAIPEVRAVFEDVA